MRIERNDPPRKFEAGGVRLSDAGRIALDPDEQVTLTTEAGGEFDVVRKDWGFYATPSLNDRLPSFGLRAALVRNADGRYFVLLVERGEEASFERYRGEQGLAIVSWLDSTEALAALEGRR